MTRWLALVLALATLGCASGGVDIATLSSNSDQVIWEAGQKALEKHEFDAARQHFKRIVDAFPQSEYGPAARLALADSHFKEGGTANYILAAAQYREFLSVYPAHAKSDYAEFQVGEAFFRQRTGTDRDQTPTERALEEFQRLQELYPRSPYAEQARQRIVECRQSLARHEFLVGFFYQRTRQAYRAAITRYEGVLGAYPDFQQSDEVLLRLAECLSAAGRYAEALPHVARLLEDYPNSLHAEAARKLRLELTEKVKAAPPALPEPPPQPSPTPKLK